ncbi:MAG: DUF5666 domain-containing protein [Acidimicrobiales bacterium]
MRQASDEPAAGLPPALPHPSTGARWRWAPSRRAFVASGALAVALGLGGASAGATTPGHSPPTHGPQGSPRSGTRPTAAGKVTALGAGTITLESRDATSQTISYSSSTTFRTLSGSSDAGALRIGDFVVVVGTRDSGGGVTATSIMFGTDPPGTMGKGDGNRPPGAVTPPGGSRPG